MTDRSASRRWTKGASAVAEAIAVVLFAGMFVTFVAGVAMRYALGQPLTWSDEFCVVLLLWSTFWTAAFVIRIDDHVTFDIAYEAVPRRLQRLMTFVASIAFGALFLAALPATYDYVSFIWRETTPTMRIRLDYLYACFPLFLGVIALRLLLRGGLLTRRDWERWL